MYHFWGVHNLYQAKLAKLNIGEQGKVGLFIFFRFSLFVFCLSLFVICFSLFIFRFSFFVIRFSLFVFHFSLFLFVFHFSFFAFRYSFIDIQNRAEYLPHFSLSYLDIQTEEAEYSIYTLKTLF